MTRAEDLLKALNGLKCAADKELSGEAREVALQHIRGLFRLAGFDGEDTGDGSNEAAVSFVQALAEVRTQAEGELFGNAFYLASKNLDDLAGLTSARLPLEPGPAPVLEPAPEPVVKPAPQLSEAVGEVVAEPPRMDVAPAAVSFDELSAASKARVSEFAASLGHHDASASDEQYSAQEQDDVLAGMQFEKRSSEPCSMPEIVPLEEEPVPPPPAVTQEAPAIVEVVDAVSAKEVAEATHDFGTLAVGVEHVPDYAAPREQSVPHAEAAAAIAPEPETAASEPEPVATAEPTVAPSAVVTKAEPRSASAAPEVSKTVATTKIETAPKQQRKEPEKTFFGLWLDMVLGRRK